MTASGMYRIDGDDWYDTYGFIVEKGWDGFTQPADTKPRQSKEWPDQHGTEYDLRTPFLKEKKITIQGGIVTDSKTDFWIKYNAMFNHFTSEGLRKVYVNELEQYFDLLYDSCPSATYLSRLTINGIDGIGCHFTLNFIQPSPFASSAPEGSLWSDSANWNDTLNWTE